MCDYSLMGVPNRLATEGEELVTYRFSTGTIGLAPPTEVRKAREAQPPVRTGFWGFFREMFSSPVKPSVLAVCVPPGAHLMLADIPQGYQHILDVGPTAAVTFTQISASANTHRDALRFEDGRELLLQQLDEDQRVLVLDLSSADPRAPEIVERRPSFVR